MYASMVLLDLDGELSSRERGQLSRALANELAQLPGFIAFIALETATGSVGGCCIYTNPMTLAGAHLRIEAWQRDHARNAESALTACATGAVIAQHGF
jgi:hypothetical protein